jgi:hypothetical protein
MLCGWSRWVEGVLGKEGVKGHVEQFSEGKEGRYPKGRAGDV